MLVMVGKQLEDTAKSETHASKHDMGSDASNCRNLMNCLKLTVFKLDKTVNWVCSLWKLCLLLLPIAENAREDLPESRRLVFFSLSLARHSRQDDRRRTETTLQFLGNWSTKEKQRGALPIQFSCRSEPLIFSLKREFLRPFFDTGFLMSKSKIESLIVGNDLIEEWKGFSRVT